MGHRQGENRHQAALCPLMIVAHEVCNHASDQRQLQAMAEAANQVLQTSCTVVAEQALADNATSLAAKQQMMRLRRSTVEHTFGTIKTQILGNARLLMRGLEGTRTELSLAVLAYNLKRVLNMRGWAWMLQAAGS